MLIDGKVGSPSGQVAKDDGSQTAVQAPDTFLEPDAFEGSTHASIQFDGFALGGERVLRLEARLDDYRFSKYGREDGSMDETLPSRGQVAMDETRPAQAPEIALMEGSESGM